ncbi:LysR substrate-binding domain-containing protein [Rhodococcus qingshengii]|uniref:LysR substrate-binding domain-containing protein n=1 Tax=Rhodococcus qingshengii TaxID=334542 RepID=UPI001ABEFD4B|nr:LysR substrate-binding domain-containing protein [Rhodococcus qingshengii]
MDVSARLLEQYVVLAEEKHFGRAAQRLAMSQPSLSQAIQRLERSLSVQLLERSTRAVVLTQAGVTFAQDARHILDTQRAAVGRTRRIARGTEGVLQVGFTSALSYTFVPQLLTLCSREFPSLRLDLHQHASATLASMVRAGHLDIAFARWPLAESEGLDVQVVAAEAVVVALPSTHPLLGRTSLLLHDLADEGFALPVVPSLGPLADMVNAVCRGAGFVPRDAARADSLSGLLAHVASGSCVCLVPAQVSTAALPGVEFRQLDETYETVGPAFKNTLKLEVVVVTRTDHSDPAVEQILSLMARIGHSGLQE